MKPQFQERHQSGADKRSYVLVKDVEMGIALMLGSVRLRIDRANHAAALVGEVHEVIDSVAFHSIWTPVPFEVALLMAEQLHLMQKDSVGGRLGWRDAGYDGEVADWYCHIQ